jgi:hypothetical protein
MKDKFLIIIVVITLIFTSCKQEYTNWYASTYDLAGEWMVTVEQSVAEYEYIFEGKGEMPNSANIESWEWEDLYDSGITNVLTYNTAKDVSNELIVDDVHSFWDYKVVVNANLDAKTFEIGNTPNLAYDDCDISIIRGKIMLDAATAPGSGNKADSIIFYIKFSDDGYGFTYMKVSGFRKTGFEEDETH